MADDIIKDVNPNVGVYNNLDPLNTKSIAVKDFNSDAMLAAVQSLIAAGLAHYALVTNVPNATSFRASALIGIGSTFFRNWYAYVLWDAAGLGAAPQDEYRVITAFNSPDATFTHAAFSAGLVVGDKVLLIHPWLAELDPANLPADIDSIVALLPATTMAAALDVTTSEGVITAAIAALNNLSQAGILSDATPFAGADIASIKAQTDKLAGAAPGVGTTAAMDLFAGVATSGETGADLVTIGANDVKNKVLSFDIDSTGITATALITVRMYKQVNGNARKFYSQTFLMGTDTVALPIIQAVYGIHEAVRVEVQSNDAADTNVTLGYDYMIEAM